MSIREVVKAVVTKVDSAAKLSGTSAYSSMRVAGATTPCLVFDLSLRQTMSMPNSKVGSLHHYEVTVDVACIADDLDSALALVENLQSEFPDAGLVSVVVGAATIKLVCTEFGEFTTRAEVPDDGQHDAERIVSGTITLQATET
jgi:hypothetical protein